MRQLILSFGRASHAAGAPEAGVNALGLIQVFNSVCPTLNLTKDVNIHGIITNGGQAANVIQNNKSESLSQSG